MQASVNENCIGCGLCATICPEVFEMNDEGLAEATNDGLNNDTMDSAKDAAEQCPVDAIDIV